MKLCLHQISFERNDQELFSGMECSLNSGELLEIRGANGTGKSTLLKIIAGFIEPTSGKILFNNQSIHESLDFYKNQLHYIGHQNGLKLDLTVKENLLFYSALFAKKSRSIEINYALAQLGVEKLLNHTCHSLSAGQLRRVSLCRLMLIKRPLWVLDEPASSLDANGQELLASCLQNNLSQGMIIILATHQHLISPTKTIQLDSTILCTD